VKRMQTLMGVIAGLIADGELNDAEILFLRGWLLENHELQQEWPASIIFRKISDILEDGIVTNDERAHLMRILTDTSGNQFSETGASDISPTTIPIDDCVTISIAGSSLCLTGEFYYGTRAACERATLKAGGVVADNVTRRVDILVVGSYASKHWVNESFGRKIEAAVKHQESGTGIEIISEARWMTALAASAAS
jgi:NAD-dependent DNA ligase